jgi:hypothetical protein
MRSFWFDPYLWVHLAGIATVPILLELCLVTLAISTPFLPEGLEYVVVAIASIGPILWMQWQRPFCIYSLLPLTLKPDELTVEQRRLLTLFKRGKGRVAAGLVAVFMAWVLWQLYRFAPLALNVAPNLPGGRITGMLGAIVTFLLANLFVQVPISVLLVLLTRESQVNSTDPYPVAVVASDFSFIGFPVRRILPELSPPAKATSVSPVAPAEVTPPVMPETVTESSVSDDPAAAATAIEAIAKQVTTAEQVTAAEPAPTLIDEAVSDEVAEPIAEEVTAVDPSPDLATEVEEVAAHAAHTDTASDDVSSEEALIVASEASEPTLFPVVDASAVVEPSPPEAISEIPTTVIEQTELMEQTETERSPEEPSDREVPN